MFRIKFKAEKLIKKRYITIYTKFNKEKKEDMELWETVNQTLDTLSKEKGFQIFPNTSRKKILQTLSKVKALRKFKIIRRLKYIKQVIVESLLRDFGVDPTNQSEVRAYLRFLRIYVTIYWSVVFTIVLGTFIYNLNQTLKSSSFTDSEYSRADMKRKMKNQKKKLKELATINSVQRGGAVETYSEAELCPAFMFIHFLKVSKSLRLKLFKKTCQQIEEKPVNNLKSINRRSKIHLLLFILLSSIKTRIGLDYLASLKEPISPICSTSVIERLYYLDFKQISTGKLKYPNEIAIQTINNSLIVQPNKKLMTLGEFELRSGLDSEVKIPISKVRSLSKIYQLNRNQVGKIRKLKKENQFLSTSFLEEEKLAEVNQKIPVLTQ